MVWSAETLPQIPSQFDQPAHCEDVRMLELGTSGLLSGDGKRPRIKESPTSLLQGTQAPQDAMRPLKNWLLLLFPSTFSHRLHIQPL